MITASRNIYLAHNFAAGDWLRDTVKPYLEDKGHVITSRWIVNPTHDPLIDATNDLGDIDKASHFVLFTEQYGERPGRGKFVELGYAIRGGKTVILVGDDTSCVFYSLPNLRRVAGWQDIPRYL